MQKRYKKKAAATRTAALGLEQVYSYLYFICSPKTNRNTFSAVSSVYL